MSEPPTLSLPPNACSTEKIISDWIKTTGTALPYPKSAIISNLPPIDLTEIPLLEPSPTLTRLRISGVDFFCLAPLIQRLTGVQSDPLVDSQRVLTWLHLRHGGRGFRRICTARCAASSLPTFTQSQWHRSRTSGDVGGR